MLAERCNPDTEDPCSPGRNHCLPEIFIIFTHTAGVPGTTSWQEDVFQILRILAVQVEFIVYLNIYNIHLTHTDCVLDIPCWQEDEFQILRIFVVQVYIITLSIHNILNIFTWNRL